MIITSTVRRDNGLFNRIRSIARRYTTKVEVGYLGEVIHINEDGKRPITLGDLASIHEHGVGYIPKRAFVKPALKQNRLKYLRFAGRQITPVIRGRQTATRVWHLLGQEAVKDVKKYMVTAKFTALSEQTVKRKGSSRPLIDTGQLRQSVTYKIK